MSLNSGTQVGPYVVRSAIGAGGMGEVYRATDTALNRDVALKLLPAAFSADADRTARLKREAQVLASLNHPNIAHVYGLEAGGEGLALAMELVDGPTLADRIATGPIPVSEAMPIALQIAEAIEYAHDRGVIHRDLKPANIKLAPDGRVKVLDFGLAKALDDESASATTSNSPTLTMRATEAGIILGTAAYMSPEQAKGKTADRRADIWSFGVVLYEMLTGRMPFAADTVSEILAQVLMKDTDLGLLPSDVPSRIRELLRRCLIRDPRGRLQAMGEARIAIEDVLAGRGATNDPARPAEAASKRGAFAWTAGLAAVFFLSTAALAAWLWLEPEPELPTVQFSVFAPEGVEFVGATMPRLSPDGRRIAIPVAAGSEVRMLVYSLETATSQVLAATEGFVPAVGAWSPDSAHFLFSTADALRRAAVSGGPSQVICKLPGTGFTAAWGPGDVILFGHPRRGPLFRVPASGGDPVPATELDATRGEEAHSHPAFLPDGRHYFFLASSGAQGRQAYLGTLDSPERVALPGIASDVRYAPSGHVLFVRDSTLMAQPFDRDALALTGDAFPVVEQVGAATAASAPVSVSETGTLAYRGGFRQGNSQLVWLDRAGAPVAVASPLASFNDIELSIDDRYVVFEAGNPGDIYVFDLARGLTTRVTTDAARDADPVWSPDGQQIAFRGDRDGGHLYARAFGVVGDDALLHKGEARESPASWSRDGRYLTFESGNDIWALPLPADGAPIRVTNTPFSEDGSQISPDGQWVAYVSNEPGSREVFIQSFPEPGVKRQVSATGGASPRWSHDGSELFYLSPQFVLMAVTVKAAGAALDTGAPVPLFEARVQTTGEANYAVASDGRFLMNVPDAERSAAPITVVLNWMGGPRRR